MKQNFLTLQYDAGAIAQYVGAGTSLLGDIFNLFGSSKANREQRDYNTSMINQQRTWALEDIKNQNQYNSPVEQMNRLKQAGLNPNMVYGTGVTGSTGQQTQQPKPTSIPSYNPVNVMGAFADMGNQMARAVATLAETQKVQPSIDLTKQQTAYTKLQTDLLELEPGSKKRYNPITGQQENEEVQDIKMNALRWQSDNAWNEHELSVIHRATTEALKESTITQGLEAAKQAIIQSDISEQQKKNLEEQWDGLHKSGILQQMDIDFRNTFFGNNPLAQKIFDLLGKWLLK